VNVSSPRRIAAWMRDTPFSCAPNGVRSNPGDEPVAASARPKVVSSLGSSTIGSAASRIRIMMDASRLKRPVPQFLLPNRSAVFPSSCFVDVGLALLFVRISPQSSQNNMPSRLLWAQYGHIFINDQSALSAKGWRKPSSLNLSRVQDIGMVDKGKVI